MCYERARLVTFDTSIFEHKWQPFRPLITTSRGETAGRDWTDIK